MASKEQKEQVSNKNKINDLRYYFGEDADEWIDKKEIKKQKVVDTWKNKSTSQYPPYLCTICNRYWSYGLTQNHKKAQFYLKKSIYGGLPCDTNTCNNCL